MFEKSESKRSVRAAGRHELLDEIILGVFLVAWGAAKGVDSKGVALIAPQSGWILPCIIGGLQLIAATVEWFSPSRITIHLDKDPPSGRLAFLFFRIRLRWRARSPWSNKRLQRSSGARGVFAGLAAVLWCYDLKEFFLDPVILSAVVLILVAPVLVVVNLYSVFANRKVWVALDPDVSTTGMHFDR